MECWFFVCFKIEISTLKTLTDTLDWNKWFVLLMWVYFASWAIFGLRSWDPPLAKSWIRTCYDIPNPSPSERNSFRLCELIYLYHPLEHPQQIVGMETGGPAQPLADPPVDVLEYTRIVLTVSFRFSGALYCEARVWIKGTVRCWMWAQLQLHEQIHVKLCFTA